MGVDVAVVGGGLAALTAATHAARLGLRATVVCDILVGGQILNVESITNFPGFAKPVSGGDLAAVVEEQARDAGVEFIFGEATALAPTDDGWVVSHDAGQDLVARCAIVATGSRLRRLGVPGEDRLEGAGVSYCGSCDGPLFADRPVVVVGGGDSAADEALTVAEHAAQVTMLTRQANLTAAATTAERVLAHPRIVVQTGVEPLEILGERKVAGVAIRELATGAVSTLEAAGVFVFVGLEPNSGLLSALVPLEDDGSVPTDPWMATSAAGLFAAGDLRRGSPRQLISVAADGATAAIAAYRYLASRSSEN